MHGSPPEREGLAPKIARLAATMTLVAALIGFALHRRAEGQLGEQLLGAGAEMMMIAGAERQDTPRQLSVNGQRVFFSSGMAPSSPAALLDRFAARCEAIDAGMMASLSELAAAHPEHAEARTLGAFRPLLRREQGGAGFVACLDLGRTPVELAALVARFRRFRESRDLHELGDLRYLYVEPAARGRAHFVAVWSEGSLRFDRLFPETGDARGDEPRHLPRPPGARRVMSAWESGTGERATIYAGSELEEGQLDGFYRRELPAEGWHILDASGDARARELAPTRGARPALVAMRGQTMAWIALSTDDEGRGRAAVITTGESEPSP